MFSLKLGHQIMSNFQSLQKISFCNANKSSDLIDCSEAIYQVVKSTSIAQHAALERLSYLIISCDVMEQKIKREALPCRDPVKLDLEHNIKKSLDCIYAGITNRKYNMDMIPFILRWCFKSLVGIKESPNLIAIIDRILLSASDQLYTHDESSYVETIFKIFSSECVDVAHPLVLVKVLTPYPNLTADVVEKSYGAFINKTEDFIRHRNVLSELSKYNSSAISSALMELLENGCAIKEKIGFVLNVLCSIPYLQPMSIMLLNESPKFKQLIKNSSDILSNSMIDDLAKLFIHSEVNSYNTVMSLLEQKTNTTSLGPSLLQKILHHLELAVYGVNEPRDGTIPFIDNMSNSEDIKMFCNCLSTQAPHKHPFVLKCLMLICYYKDGCIAKSVVSELLCSQPLDRFQNLLNKVLGIYPNLNIECFKSIIRDVSNFLPLESSIVMFFENCEKMKLCGNPEITSLDMVKIASILNECGNLKLISLLLRFLDPKAIDIADTICITSNLCEVFVKLVDRIASPVDVELLEVIGDIKNNIVKWCPIKDCIRLTILNKLLSLITGETMDVNVQFDDTCQEQDNFASSLRSAIVESDKDVHRGHIRKRVKLRDQRFSHLLAVQSIMNLIQSVVGNSPKSRMELCKFILDLVCPDVNLEAPWPEAASMKYTLERDLNVLNAFNETPILWEVFSEAMVSRAPELIVVVRALFVVLLSFWSSVRVKKCSDSPQHLSMTVKLLELLSEVEWLPPPLFNVSQLIPIISPHEAMTLLYEISNHFKLYSPHLTNIPVTKFSPSLKEAVCLIVHKNIEHIGVSAFLFSRWGISGGDS